MTNEILLASGNPHKALEFSRMMPGYRILLPKDLGLKFSCEETGTTFIDNALIKARALFAAAHDRDIPVMADDSGLCVDALGGRPGIRSARYGMQGGRELESGQRNALLLKELAPYTDLAQRGAHFVCALVLMLSPYRIVVFQETVAGHIAFSPYGQGGFGYDPIFIIDGLGKHMAAISDQEKDAWSHRGRACRHLLAFLGTLSDTTKE